MKILKAPPISKASVLDPNWKYVSAADTNIAKTFARIRREMKEREAKTVTHIETRRRANKGE